MFAYIYIEREREREIGILCLKRPSLLEAVKPLYKNWALIPLVTEWPKELRGVN